MKIKNIIWQIYRVPFAHSFQTAKADLKIRQGLILQIETDDGLVGVGEAAPLPPFSPDTLDEVLQELALLKPRLIGETLAVFPLAKIISPALRCGLDTAFLDLQAKTANQSVANLLAGHPTKPSVTVNATIGVVDTAEAVLAAQMAIEAGFGTIKLKVGVLPTVKQELERIRQVQAHLLPTTKLRLDANGAWTFEQAYQILSVLENIELVEQPLASDQIPQMAALRKQVNVLIAADESVTSLSRARQIIELGAADVLVIKPMIVGGLTSGYEIIQQAQQAHLQAFVTTTLDSGIGIAAALQLAAILPELALACGLATASLLTSSLVENLPIVQAGKMVLPDGFGLGVKMDKDLCKQFQ